MSTTRRRTGEGVAQRVRIAIVHVVRVVHLRVGVLLSV